MAQGMVASSRVALVAVMLLVVTAGCSSDDSDTASGETTTIPIADSNSPDTSTLAAGDADHPGGTTITVSLDAIEGLRGHAVSAWVLPVELNEDKDAIGGTSFWNITDDPFSDSKKIQPQGDRYFDVIPGESPIVEPGTYRFIIEAYVPSGPMHYGCEMPIEVDGDEPIVLTISSLPTYTGGGWHWTAPEQIEYPDCPD